MTAPEQTPPPDLDAIQAELDAIANLAPAAEDSTGSLANQRFTRAWANIGRHVPDLIADVERLRGLVDDLRDPDPCWYDHHGYCQAHGWMETDPSCPHARAAELFAEGGEGR